MNVLGISGLEPSVAYKRALLGDVDEREHRISQGHDAAAALVVDGEIIAAAAEERFNRRKHCGDFPIGAIRYCLDEAGLDLADVDVLAHAFDYSGLQGIFTRSPEAADLYRRVFSRDALLDLVARDLPAFPIDRVTQVHHHLAHAASAYFTSGWDECLVIVIDGMGETDSASIYHARDGQLQRLQRVSARNSIGILYSLVTLHLGFDFNADEYKIMGLAPYGDPARFRDFFAETVVLHEHGGFSIPLLQANRTFLERERYTVTREQLAKGLVPERRPEDPIEPIHQDVAAALQECLDRTMLHLCGRLGASTKLRRLALAGGVALNCTANGKLLDAGLFDDIYVQPASGDDGSALGAALWAASRQARIPNCRMPVPFLGPSHARADIDEAIASAGDRIRVERFNSLDETVTRAADYIAAGRVIAWFRGRMEFGPRALGHRSILADPGHPEMRDRINAMVKMREAFRPFAPAVTIEQASRWFELQPCQELPYMIMTVDVRDEHRAALPAVTHVNGSARVQTVSRRDNADLHRLLEAVGRTTGREMVLNTSFNVKGQPIVNTPREALDTFLTTGIDHLFLEDVAVTRA